MYRFVTTPFCELDDGEKKQKWELFCSHKISDGLSYFEKSHNTKVTTEVRILLIN